MEQFLQKDIIVEQVKSSYGIGERQRANLKGLGLCKMGRKSELKATPEVIGMLKKVAHLVKVTAK